MAGVVPENHVVKSNIDELLEKFIRFLETMGNIFKTNELNAVLFGEIVHKVMVWYKRYSELKPRFESFLLDHSVVDVMIDSLDTLERIRLACQSLLLLDMQPTKSSDMFDNAPFYTGVLKLHENVELNFKFMIADKFPKNFLDIDDLTCAIHSSLDLFHFCLGFPKTIDEQPDKNKLKMLFYKARQNLCDVTSEGIDMLGLAFLNFKYNIFYTSEENMHKLLDDTTEPYFSRIEKYEGWDVMFCGENWKNIYPLAVLKRYSECIPETPENLDRVKKLEDHMHGIVNDMIYVYPNVLLYRKQTDVLLKAFDSPNFVEEMDKIIDNIKYDDNE